MRSQHMFIHEYIEEHIYPYCHYKPGAHSHVHASALMCAENNYFFFFINDGYAIMTVYEQFLWLLRERATFPALYIDLTNIYFPHMLRANTQILPNFTFSQCTSSEGITQRNSNEKIFGEKPIINHFVFISGRPSQHHQPEWTTERLI